MYLEPHERRKGMSYQEVRAERKKKIFLLREKAQCDKVALQLFYDIELECGMILETPDVPINIIKRYNQIVLNSDLPLPERKQLLMEEKSE